MAASSGHADIAQWVKEQGFLEQGLTMLVQFNQASLLWCIRLEN
jgi:hypothetical protein